MTVGGEIFHILCKRVAAAAHPEELTGVRFNAPCDGMTGAASTSDPRFASMIEHRAEVVAALDQIFGDSATPTAGGAAFATGELDEFLANLIPFYDKPEEWTPRSTRAIGKIMEELVSEEKIPDEVLKALARVAPRVGYRPLAQVLGAVRPALTYPRLDELTRTFMPLVTEGGSAYQAFSSVLRAGALELAEEKDPEAPPASQSTLRAAVDLLFAEDPAFAAPNDAPVWVVKRDDRGRALPTSLSAPFVEEGGFAKLGADGNFASSVAGFKIPSPFPRVASDTRNRDTFGRAIDGQDKPIFQHIDANRTFLAALMREQYDLLRREGNDRSTVEKLARGLRPIMGETTQRTERFGAKASLSFEGPSVETGPIFDLVHAITVLARYEETDHLIELLQILMQDHETDAAAPVYMGLRIDEISDEYPEAQLFGVDGPGSPHEFWDDLIQIGTRMLERGDQLHAVVDSFADPQAVAATRLIAKFMKYKDQVTYSGARVTVGADGKYPAADADRLNEEIKHTLKQEVERALAAGELTDKGMNRSLFQRLLSTIYATNGTPNCNKNGAQLNVKDPTTGAALTFPDATGQPPIPGNALEGVAWLAIDALCGPGHSHSGPHSPAPSYKECEFVKQPNGAETHMRSMLLDEAGLGRSYVTLKDTQLACLDENHLAGDLGATQEADSQFKGFTLQPSANSLARFIHAPRNKFVSDLFAPFGTRHGVPLADFEPDLLFALEAKQPDILHENKPQSFLTAAQGLGKAFDDHEFFEDSDDGEVATKGYMFAELLSALHKHWPSRRPADFRCPSTVQKGDEGCSQSGDPTAPFFSSQSNLVSYEPLLIRAIEEENLGDILQKSNATLRSITIGNQNGVQVLTSFLKRMLTVDETLRYRDGRNYSVTNTCDAVKSTGPDGEEVAECMADANGRPKGRVVKGVMPIYLLLDALKGIDRAFEGQNSERHEPWLAARSKLVDQFLAVVKDETDPLKPNYTLKNQRGRAVALTFLPWARARIKLYRDQGDEQLRDWSEGLAGRMANVLGHPAVAAGLDLLDVLWSEDKAGAEFAAVSSYLMDEATHPDAFKGLLVAAVDTLNIIDRDPNLTPLVQFASLALAPNALKVIQNGGDPDVKESAALLGLELAKRVTALYPGPEASPLSRILKNAVLSNFAGEAPLEEIIDSSAEVNRQNPADPREKSLTAEDYKAVFTQVKDFLLDSDRGMERLYKVIQGRDLSRAQGGAN